jgi:hypothetical protein
VSKYLFVAGPKHGQEIEVQDGQTVYQGLSGLSPVAEPVIYRRVKLENETHYRDVFVINGFPEQHMQAALSDAIVRIHNGGKGIDDLIAQWLEGGSKVDEDSPSELGKRTTGGSRMDRPRTHSRAGIILPNS